MTVIAMTREMGTLGKDVAAQVAKALGMEVVHHELVEHQIAERLNTTGSAVHRFLEGEASLWERWRIDNKRLSRYTAEEVLQLAARGNVLIRGWGAAQLLRDVPHVLSVRICAPMRARVSEMQKRLNLDKPDVARREIERSDDAHAGAVQRQFQLNWTDPTLYDIVLNTGNVPVATCSEIVTRLAQSAHYAATDESRQVLDDKLLEARIRSILDEHETDSPIGSGLIVKATRGDVVIQGVVSPGSKLQKAIRDLSSLDGVRALNDETVSIGSPYGP